MKVNVTKTGFIGMRRVYEGEILDVTEKQFSKHWMEPIGSEPKKPANKSKQQEKKEKVSDESLDVI